MPNLYACYKDVLHILLQVWCILLLWLANFLHWHLRKKKKQKKKHVPSFPLESTVVESEASLCCSPKGIKLLCVTSLLLSWCFTSGLFGGEGGERQIQLFRWSPLQHLLCSINPYNVGEVFRTLPCGNAVCSPCRSCCTGCKAQGRRMDDACQAS